MKGGKKDLASSAELFMPWAVVSACVTQGHHTMALSTPQFREQYRVKPQAINKANESIRNWKKACTCGYNQSKRDSSPTN